jgi:hypothetical protein
MSENFILTNQILTREINDATNQDQTNSQSFYARCRVFCSRGSFKMFFESVKKTRQQLLVTMMSTFFEFLERFFYPIALHCICWCCFVNGVLFLISSMTTSSIEKPLIEVNELVN